MELLDKFKSVQEKARRLQRLQTQGDVGTPIPGLIEGKGKEKDKGAATSQPGGKLQRSGSSASLNKTPASGGQGHKPKSSLSNLGRFTSGVGARKTKR